MSKPKTKRRSTGTKPARKPMSDKSPRLAPRKAKAHASGRKPKTGAAPTAGRETKQAAVIALLKRPGGATIDDLVAATGWQPHSVRGAMSGTLKKHLGLAIGSEKSAAGPRTYRIS